MKEKTPMKIKKLRTERNLTQQQVADALGISRVAVSKWESGDTKDLKRDNLVGLTKLFSVSLEELLNAVPAKITDDYDLPHPTDDEFAMVPQLDIAASCGDGCFHDHVVVKGGLAFKRSSLREFGIPEAAARIIYAKGGSMWPSVKDGCVVLLNTAEKEPKEGRVFAICTPDGDLVLKRLVWEFHPAMGAQTWVMRSDNPDKTAHPDKILPPDDRTMIVGLAVWNDNRL